MPCTAVSFSTEGAVPVADDALGVHLKSFHLPSGWIDRGAPVARRRRAQNPGDDPRVWHLRPGQRLKPTALTAEIVFKALIKKKSIITVDGEKRWSKKKQFRSEIKEVFGGESRNYGGFRSFTLKKDTVQ